MSDSLPSPEPAPRVLAPIPAPRSPRLRARLAALLALGVVWVLPWFGSETGATHAGAPGALALVVAWGLAATLAVARTREALAVGEAGTSLALAALAAALAIVDHPWLRGPAGASSLVPVFVPLAALCLLDLALRVARPGTGREVTALRAGAAILAGASLAAALRWVPAAAALAVGALPATAQLPRSIDRARRALEVASLGAAVALFLAPEAHRAATGAAESVEAATIWAFAFRLLSLALGAAAVFGVLADVDAAESPSPATSPR